jgi:7-cyano-7-deazaguanine synthase in queuosine biosynthesis
MWQDIPEALLDLLDVAAYVYCADQAIPRGGETDRNFGEDWRRKLSFVIPVRQFELWNRSDVQAQVVSTLSFLSEDEYSFRFEPLSKGEPSQSYFRFTGDRFGGRVEEVVLFSGGLDSLGGAVQEAVVDKRNVVLVHHRSTGKRTPRHRRLLRLLEEHSGEARPVHIPVRVNKKKRLNREYTQRTRSFLYASLGATVAAMLGLSRVRLYENGVVSLNLPPSAQVVGARASRTTHPQVLQGLSALLSALVGKTFTVDNPFLWKTKTEVVRGIVGGGCGELIGHTISCAHTWKMTKQHAHCGTCSQCIDRRFAVLAAGQEAADPARAYKVDLLTGERDQGPPRTMLAVYLETASQIACMDALRFFSRYGEASRVLRHVNDPPEAAALKVFDLYRRHAQEVSQVVDEAVARLARAIRRRELPPSCLVRLVCDASGAGAPPSSAPARLTFGAGASGPENVFRRTGEVWQVRFAGGKEFFLRESKGAAYLHLLLSHPGASFSAADLVSRVARVPRPVPLGDAGETADPEALTAYRERYEELKGSLEEARANHDLGCQERIQHEMGELAAELERHQGLGPF